MKICCRYSINLQYDFLVSWAGSQCCAYGSWWPLSLYTANMSTDGHNWSQSMISVASVEIASHIVPDPPHYPNLASLSAWQLAAGRIRCEHLVVVSYLHDCTWTLEEFICSYIFELHFHQRMNWAVPMFSPVLWIPENPIISEASFQHTWIWPLDALNWLKRIDEILRNHLWPTVTIVILRWSSTKKWIEFTHFSFCIY